MKKLIVALLILCVLVGSAGCTTAFSYLLSSDSSTEPTSSSSTPTKKPTTPTQPTEPEIPVYIENTLEDVLGFWRLKVVKQPKKGENTWVIQTDLESYTLTVIEENGKVSSVTSSEGIVFYQNGKVVKTKDQYEKAEYKKECKTISYSDLARNPDKYKYDKFKFTGEVIQVMDDGYDTVLRINVTPYTIGDSVHYKDTIYAEVMLFSGDDRILEDDIITIWGHCTGLITYESIFGQQISIPGMDIEYYEIA